MTLATAITVIAALTLAVVSSVTVVVKTPCVTTDELRNALKRAGHEITIKGGRENQRTWRQQAYEMVLKQYQGYKVCDGIFDHGRDK